MKITYATLSKTGKRSDNEDAFCVIDEKESEKNGDDNYTAIFARIEE